jgi:hypothetical protein
MVHPSEPRLFPLLHHVSNLQSPTSPGPSPWSLALTRSLRVYLALRNARFVSSTATTVRAHFRTLSHDEVAGIAEVFGNPMHIALSQLRRHLSRQPVDTSRDGILRFRRPFHLQASAILLPDWLAMASRHLGDPFLAILPSQDRLTLFRDSGSELAEARQHAVDGLRESLTPLSSTVFRVSGGRLTPVRETSCARAIP